MNAIVSFMTAVAIVVGWRVAPAHAGCAVPEPVQFSPPAGAVLPANPTVYIFVRADAGNAADPRAAISAIDKSGKSLSIDPERITQNGPAQVFRVQIPASTGEPTVHVRIGKQRLTARYLIKKKPRPVNRARTRIVGASYEYATGDPGTDAFFLSIEPQAPLYRVRYDRDQIAITPDWSSRGKSGRAARGTIIMGRVGCLDLTVRTDTPFDVEITPLFLDGEEGASYTFSCEGNTCSNHRSVELRGRLRFSPL